MSISVRTPNPTSASASRVRATAVSKSDCSRVVMPRSIVLMMCSLCSRGRAAGVGGSGQAEEELLQFGQIHRFGAVGGLAGDAFAQPGGDDREAGAVEGAG